VHRNRAQIHVIRFVKAPSDCSCQQRYLVLIASFPHWPYGMDNILAREISTAGNRHPTNWKRTIFPVRWINRGSIRLINYVIHLALSTVIACPPLRLIAAASPPPCMSISFAALTMASVSSSVRSPCLTLSVYPASCTCAFVVALMIQKSIDCDPTPYSSKRTMNAPVK